MSESIPSRNPAMDTDDDESEANTVIDDKSIVTSSTGRQSARPEVVDTAPSPAPPTTVGSPGGDVAGRRRPRALAVSPDSSDDESSAARDLNSIRSKSVLALEAGVGKTDLLQVVRPRNQPLTTPRILPRGDLGSGSRSFASRLAYSPSSAASPASTPARTGVHRANGVNTPGSAQAPASPLTAAMQMDTQPEEGVAVIFGTNINLQDSMAIFRDFFCHFTKE